MNTRFAKVFCLLLPFSFGCAVTFSQVDTKIVPPRPIPPSPDVASLFKFSEVPVNNYTGLPQVDVPVYDLKLKDITIPVRLQYHTGGVKVDEVASSVGMNWSLTAGGSINVMIRGKSDLMGGYPLNSPITPEVYAGHGIYDLNAPEGGVSYRWGIEAVNGTTDPEPDMFNFSAPEISGKFFFGLKGEIHTSPVMPLKIEPTTQGLKIVNSKGVIYLFGPQEMSYSTSSGSENINYYLFKIITPSKDTVDFNYEPVNYAYKNYFGESRVKFLSGYHSVDLMAQAGDMVNSRVMYDSIKVIGWRIKSINCTNGVNVNFNYAIAARKDLPGTNSLADISVFYKTNFIKKVVLQQEYRGNISSPDKCRLWLSQLYEEGAGGLKAAPYVFTYNSKVLPDRLNNGQDHWGYYNGRGSNSRLPKNDEYWPGDARAADRRPDTSVSNAGLLTRIQYPTGGTTEFTYEPNDIWVENERTIDRSFPIEGVYGTSYTVAQRVISIPASASSFRIFYNTYATPPSGGTGIEDPTADDPTCAITVKTPGGQTLDYSTKNSNPNGDPVNWVPGDYTVTVNTFGDNMNGFFEVHYDQNDTSYYTGSKIVGGWRVKKLVYNDAYNPGASKVYKYVYDQSDTTPGHSSGVLPVENPQYEYFRTLAVRKVFSGPIDDPQSEPPTVELQNCLVVVQSANSVLPLWGDHGHIFYPVVTVYNGENGENGKSIYNYSYLPSAGGYYGYPFVPSANNEWYCGSLIKQEDYRKETNGKYKLIQSTENVYGIGPDSVFWKPMFNIPEPPSYLKGIGITVYTELPEMNIGLNVYPYQFIFNDYHYISAWLHLDSTIVKQYGDNQATPFITTTAYDYKNGLSLRPTEVKTITSKNETIRILNSYSSDYKGTAVYDKMVARNIVDPVITETSYRDSRKLLFKRNNYLPTVDDILLPASIDRAIYNNGVETEISFSKYDNRGNLLEYTAKDGVIHSFIWGYNSNYPVAEIVGCNYTLASSYVTLPALLSSADPQQVRTELNKIRTGLASTPALVTTMTYVPEVGVTSVTDPTGNISFYEYDGLNRLKVVKDQNGKILKQYDYQFQVPVTR
ncbi:hypothetical protein [Chitinophaga sp. Ak27]|uniref:hypothetical protein n=1 Tax=Chitinophaga sp. Ak27 TaxID=2726116 RepID=UPI00145C960B|nr:hypothetical protein [Chitinophaga sp. Ak27]NLU92202.1 hypothetical protein [Chitinophaga sp. Ak27]